MRRFSRSAFVLSGVVLLTALPVDAGRGYIGGSVGESDIDVSISDLDDGSLSDTKLDNSDTVWKVFGGFDFIRFFGIEAAVQDLGDLTFRAVSDGTGLDYSAGAVDLGASVDTISASAVGRIPLGERASIFGKYGVHGWDAEVRLSNAGMSERESDDGTDPFYGVGLQFDGKRVGFRLEWEEFQDVVDVDISLVSVGIVFGFGEK